MATASETLAKIFRVGEIPTLKFSNVAGTLSITPGESGLISVEAVKKASGSTLETAQESIAQMNVTIEQDGDSITVVGKPEHSFTRLEKRTIDFTITVPHTTNLDLKLTAGKMEVFEVSGDIAIDMTAGSLYIGGCDGEISLGTNASDTKLDGVTFTGSSHITFNAGQMKGDIAIANGAALDVRGTAGSARLALPANAAVRLQAKVTAGDIRISDFPVTTTRKMVTAYAEGDLQPETNASLAISMTAGDIAISAQH